MYLRPVGRSTVHDVVARLQKQRRRKGKPFPAAGTVGRELASVRRDAARSRAQPQQPWVPAEYGALGDAWEGLVAVYAVVDDQDDDTAVVALSPWPGLDYRYRLVFEPAEDIDLPAPLLWEFLSRYRCGVAPDGTLRTMIFGEGRALRRREVRVGDTFALSAAAAAALRAMAAGAAEAPDASGIIVLDVSADARDAAKVAFYAAATGTLDPESPPDRQLAATIWVERTADELRERLAQRPGL